MINEATKIFIPSSFGGDLAASNDFIAGNNHYEPLIYAAFARGVRGDCFNLLGRRLKAGERHAEATTVTSNKSLRVSHTQAVLESHGHQDSLKQYAYFRTRSGDSTPREERDNKQHRARGQAQRTLARDRRRGLIGGVPIEFSRRRWAVTRCRITGATGAEYRGTVTGIRDRCERN